MANTVGEVMSADPALLYEDATIDQAARVMRDRAIGAVVVVAIEDRNKVRGILTDRDIVVRAVADDRTPSGVRVGEVCSRELTTIAPVATVEDAAELMRKKALRRIVVVDEGRPVGMISLGDLAIERSPNSALADISAAPANR